MKIVNIPLFIVVISYWIVGICFATPLLFQEMIEGWTCGSYPSDIALVDEQPGIVACFNEIDGVKQTKIHANIPMTRVYVTSNIKYTILCDKSFSNADQVKNAKVGASVGFDYFCYYRDYNSSVNTENKQKLLNGLLESATNDKKNNVQVDALITLTVWSHFYQPTLGPMLLVETKVAVPAPKNCNGKVSCVWSSVKGWFTKEEKHIKESLTIKYDDLAKVIVHLQEIERVVVADTKKFVFEGYRVGNHLVLNLKTVYQFVRTLYGFVDLARMLVIIGREI